MNFSVKKIIHILIFFMVQVNYIDTQFTLFYQAGRRNLNGLRPRCIIFLSFIVAAVKSLVQCPSQVQCPTPYLCHQRMRISTPFQYSPLYFESKKLRIRPTQRKISGNFVCFYCILSDEIMNFYDFTIEKVEFHIIFSHFVKLSEKYRPEAPKKYIFSNMKKCQKFHTYFEKNCE